MYFAAEHILKGFCDHSIHKRRIWLCHISPSAKRVDCIPWQQQPRWVVSAQHGNTVSEVDKAMLSVLLPGTWCCSLARIQGSKCNRWEHRRTSSLMHLLRSLLPCQLTMAAEKEKKKTRTQSISLWKALTATCGAEGWSHVENTESPQRRNSSYLRKQ